MKNRRIKFELGTPDADEIKYIIHRLKNNKASGEDSIVAELLKIMDSNLPQVLEHFFKRIWDKEEIPEEWKCALIHPLLKKGDRTDVNNYRGISLLPVAHKILSRKLLQIIEPALEKEIGEYQAGFRRGRFCIDQIFNLKTI